MKNKEILTALEYVIYQDVKQKFVANSCDIEEARLIMKSVYCRFLENYLEYETLKSISKQDGETENEKDGNV